MFAQFRLKPVCKLSPNRSSSGGHRILPSRLYLLIGFAIFWIPSNGLASQWKLLKSDTQPIAVAFHRQQVNSHLIERFRQKKGIGSRVLTSSEIAQVVQMRNAIVAKTLRWAEQSYQKEVNELGFEPPAGIWREIGGKLYLILFLYDFGEDSNTYGTVRRSDSKLSLNIRSFWKRMPTTSGPVRRVLKGTIAHEMFHAIQNRYAVEFSRWAKESTAEWCVEKVFPQQDHFVPLQGRFLKHPQHSLHRVQSDDSDHTDHTSGHSHSGYAHHLGRPYGASAFWMFLEKHHRPADDSWMKKLWIEARSDLDAYSALATILGDDQKFGPKFRDYYARFAVGSLLHAEAPAECQWHDVDRLVAKKGGQIVKLRSPTVKLKKVWQRYAETGLTGPDSSVMTVQWTDGAESINSQTGTRFQVDKKHGGMAGAAFRIFSVPVSTVGRHDLPLRVEVTAGESEIAMRALVKENDQWKVLPSTFESQNGRHQLVIPKFATSDHSYVYIVVCRFGDDLQPKSYSLRFSLVQPPTVRLVRLTQSGKTLFEARWQEQLSATDKLLSRNHKQSSLTLPAKSSTAAIEMIVEMDQEVRPGIKPACRLNGTDINLGPAESDRIWRCQFSPNLLRGPARQQLLEIAAELKLGPETVHISLDENPTTIAALDMNSNNWAGYEHDGGAMVITMKPKATYTARLNPNSMVRQQQKGPVWVSPTLNDAAAGFLDQPYVVEVRLGPHRQFLYPTNIKSYGFGSHPLRSLASFILPEGLTEKLPEKLTATYVMADGTRIVKEFPLKFQSKRDSSFGSSGDDIEKEKKRWQKRYQDVMAREQDPERKFSMLTREGTQLIIYTNQFESAQSIWTETVSHYQQARNQDGADRKWLDRRFAACELVMMGIAYKFQRTDELLKLLEDRTRRGQATTTDYIGTIDAVVRFKNDTSTAHRLWKKMQSLPEANRAKPQRSVTAENWRFTYDTLTDYSKELKLPKQPIKP